MGSRVGLKVWASRPRDVLAFRCQRRYLLVCTLKDGTSSRGCQGPRISKLEREARGLADSHYGFRFTGGKVVF